MKNSLLKIYLLLLVPLLLMIACKQKLQHLTNEESVAFAKEVESSIKKGDGAFLDNSIDKDAFVGRMNLAKTKDSRGFGEGIMDKLKLGTQITNSLTGLDNFEFIKHYVKDEKHHLIFRLYGDKESTLNYHDYELIKVNDKCKIADLYIYLSGETLAETMRNLYNSVIEKSNGSDQQKLKGIEEVGDIRKLMQRGKNAEAKRRYDVLPAYLKNSKTIMLLNVLVCSNLTNEEYNEAINQYNEKFPGEQNMNLMMIDGYFLQKDYVKMLAAVNALDAQINKDPLLDFYRYVSYKLLEDKENARLYLNRLVKNKPEFQKGLLELITVELDRKNKPVADSLVAIYRKKTKFNQEELNDLLGFY